MLSAHFHHGVSRALAAEEGVSLIELLVAILAGMIVIIALFNLQIVTLHQTTRVFTKVDATQHARVAIEDLGNELTRRASSTTSRRFSQGAAAQASSSSVRRGTGRR